MPTSQSNQSINSTPFPTSFVPSLFNPSSSSLPFPLPSPSLALHIPPHPSPPSLPFPSLPSLLPLLASLPPPNPQPQPSATPSTNATVVRHQEGPAISSSLVSLVEPGSNGRAPRAVASATVPNCVSAELDCDSYTMMMGRWSYVRGDATLGPTRCAVVCGPVEVRVCDEGGERQG